MRKAAASIIIVGLLVVPMRPTGHADSVHVTVDVSTPVADIIVTPRGTTVAIEPRTANATYFQLNDPGKPALPARIVRVLIPNGFEYESVQATVASTRALVSGKTVQAAPEPVAPADDPAPQPKTLQPALAASSSSQFPSERVRYLGTGYLHGHAIASFAVFPVSVTDGDVVVHEDISLRVDTRVATGAAPVRALRATAQRSRSISSRVGDTVWNRDALNGYPSIPAQELRGPFQPSGVPSLEGSPVDGVIVTPAALAPQMQVLADFRTASGVPTVVRTTEWILANYRRGTDLAETVRFFLQDAYSKWGIQWVTLAGDTPEIPARYLYSTYYYGGTLIPADLYFAALDGNFNADADTRFGESLIDAPDLEAEVCVGRIPVSSPADAATVVSKIINYETPVRPSYTDKVLYLAEVLFPSPWSPPTTIQQNGADIAEWVATAHAIDPSRRVTRSYETNWLFPGSVLETRAAALDSLEAGYNHVFHVGHGYRFNMHCADNNIAIPDADAMLNEDQYFNLYMLNCTASAFDFDCLAEHMLRNPSGGAVSVVGASNSAFADISANYMEEYNDVLFNSPGPVRIGDAFESSRASRTALAQAGDTPDFWAHYIYTLLGDPSMSLWTGPVDSLNVAHAASLPAGTNLFPVTVLANGLPRANATVCIWKSGEDYQSQTTNLAGQAVFTVNAASAGNLRVVVTGTNIERYDTSIPVTPVSPALLSVLSTAVDDDNVGGTFGNGDGIIDAGETVDLLPTLRNAGGAISPVAVALLGTPAPFVTVLDATAAVGTIAAGGNAAANDPWRISILATAADEAIVDFTVGINGGGPVWNAAFSRVVHAPVLSLTLLRKSDAAPVGNGDGTIIANEHFRLYATVRNYGTGRADGVSAVLRSESPNATVIDSLAGFAAVSHLSDAESTPGFRLFESNVGTSNTLKIIVTDGYGRSFSRLIELRNPTAPTITSFDASLGVDKMLMMWNPSIATDVAGYYVYRSAAQGGPFTRATPDLIAHTVYTDGGLAPSTRYYFGITAVDQSGNESPMSAVAAASTNPPQLTGWPNALVDQSANSPAIGDVDGDGRMEVVVGNNLLYAFNDDGSEVRDGDGQGITWGVFSTSGQDFVGPAALARLDDNPGLEIVAATYTSKQVFVFDKNGTVLPGWPRTTSDVIRAGVAVGDIDGNGDLEIVAVDQDAYLYAWNVDGSEFIDGDANPLTQGVFRRLPDTTQWQYQMAALADIDNDGKDEVIIPTQDKKLYVMNELGADQAGWPRTLPNFAGGGVAIGDIDNNGDLEIVVTTRNTGETYALNHDNTQMWIRWLPTNLFFNPSPALADLTGDGKLETIIASSNGRVYAVQYNGSDAPGWPVVYATTSYAESSPVVGDVNGDGLVDVLLGDEARYINAWSSTGVALEGFPLVTKDAVRGTPAIVDMDDDGDVEIVAVGYDRMVYVWNLSAAYNPAKMPWPMFHANIHRDGRYGHLIATGVDDDVPAVARTLVLAQNYPNPFNPVTSIVYEIPEGAGGHVSLTVYDVTGARVRTLVNGTVRAGRHSTRWDGRTDNGSPVGSGVYFYRLTTAGGQALTRKMVLLK